MPVALNRTQGCLLGLALGDAWGAPFEGGWLERLLWRLIGTTRDGMRRWTDDTQMTLDVIETYLDTGALDPDSLAQQFAQSYRWSRGYGPGAAKVLRRIATGMPWPAASRSVYPQGSFGNGAAMRAPIFGVIFSDRPEELRTAVEQTARITHGHPLAIVGAELIAVATACLFHGERDPSSLQQTLGAVDAAEYAQRLATAFAWLNSNREVAPREVVRSLGNGITAPASCVTALYLSLRFLDQPFPEMLRFIATCGGDADTIGAMAGALWGTANGYSALPAEWLHRLEAHDRLLQLATELHARVS